MKFRNLSRTLLLLAGSVGITLGLTSCSADHTAGYVYVLGTTVQGQPGGQISAFREYNNAGNLVNVQGSPTGSGGQNPVRAVIPAGNRFMYVLNAGAQMPTDSSQPVTYTDANIQLFSIGGYGQLAQQTQYFSQGFGSRRIAVDSSGAHLFVLDEYAPVGITAGSTSSPTAVSVAAGQPAPTGYPCQDPTNPNVYHPTGDITVFTIDGNTGRLQVQANARQLNLNYFPVGCFPVDFRIAGQFLYTMDAGSATTNDVETVNVQAVGSTGQLTPTQTSSIKVGNGMMPVDISAVNGDNASKYLYLIDTANNNLYLYSVGTSGALTPLPGTEPYFNGNNTSAGGPVQSVVDSTGKFLYVINAGPPTGVNNPIADVGSYTLNSTTGYIDNNSQGSPFNFGSQGTIAGPVCIFEDTTNQYLYTAGSLDNSITGRKIDPQSGTLRPLNVGVAFPTVETPSWCLGISSTL